ncbi:MAG: hypothetical protein IPJ74_21375 [Saprospiraceae bacterium]|nr:hypothetical protein [Saprospiraceae bacterium]
MKFTKVMYYSRVVLVLIISVGCGLHWNKLNAQIANISIDIPTPHGGNLGTIGGGFAFQSRTRDTEKGFNPDANFGFGIGLGDFKKAVGLTVGANIFGLSNDIGEGDNFGSGTLDLQVNRAINDYIFVGIGARNLTKWRSPELRARNLRSYFLTSNFIIPIHRRYDEPFSLLFVTTGVGNGIFRLDKDFTLRESGNFNLFGSVALQVLRGTNIIAEWNGYDLNAGISFYPFKKIPALGATASLADLTEERTRFIFSAGYSFNFIR